MAEIFEPGAALDAFLTRQRTALTQSLRQAQTGNQTGSVRNGPAVQGDQQVLANRQSREPTTGEQSQTVRNGQIQREHQIQQFVAASDLRSQEANRAFTRTIDQHGNVVRQEIDQSSLDRQAVRQAQIDNAQARQQRIDERQAQDRAFRIDQRIQEQTSQQRIDQTSFDATLPRGSIVDISA